jgi:hypothetical protein
MKFKKSEFKNRYKKEKEGVDELFNPNGEFGGDMPHKPTAEIKVGTVKAFDDNSDYKPDMTQTTDDFAKIAKSKSNWWLNVGYGGTPYSRGAKGSMIAEDENIKEITKKNVSAMFEDILNNRSEDNEVVKKVVYSDVNRNNIPDLTELTNKALISKIDDFIKVLNATDLTENEVVIILNHIIINTDTSKISNDYKNILRKKI